MSPSSDDPRPDSSRLRAGIEIAGRTLRYAEVEAGPRPRLEDVEAGLLPGPRLLRLGACDFDFPVTEALLEAGPPAQLDALGAALREIFRGSEAETLGLAVHPWHATSFFTPLPEGLPPNERLEQLRQEAAMLSDVRLGPSLRVAATPVRLERRPDGTRFLWHHVMRVPEAVQARAQHLAGRLREGARPAMADTAGAAAAVLRHLVRARPSEAAEADPYLLALGLYGPRIELSLCRGETWLFGHWAEAPADADGPYFAAALLERLGVPREAVERLYVYGEADRPELVRGVERVLGVRARVLNPLKLFRLARSHADPRALAAYVPAIGAALP